MGVLQVLLLASVLEPAILGEYTFIALKKKKTVVSNGFLQAFYI